MLPRVLDDPPIVPRPGGTPGPQFGGVQVPCRNERGPPVPWRGPEDLGASDQAGFSARTQAEPLMVALWVNVLVPVGPAVGNAL